MIAARRKEALTSALRFAKFVFDEASEEQKVAIRDYVLQGLDYLAEELKYDRTHDRDLDVPSLRWLCAELVLVYGSSWSERPSDSG